MRFLATARESVTSARRTRDLLLGNAPRAAV
jgi:hypothetical protein